MDNEEFLGIGWSFPPEFSISNRKVVMVKGYEDIQQSLEILVSTNLGERILRSDFGTSIHTLPFENITVTLMTKLKRLIEKAILKYEPRIALNAIFFTKTNPEEGLLYIQIDYTVRATNSRQNYVYPFYLREGTLISK